MTTETVGQKSTAIGALVLAVVGFFVPLIGIIIATIALVMITKVTDPEYSGYKIATNIISWLTLVGYLLIFVLIIINFIAI